MRQVYSFFIPRHERIDALMRISKDLHNQALYVIRKKLEEEHVWIRYNDLCKLMPTVTNLEGKINYRLLKAQCSQQILRQVDKDMKSFFAALKDWKKHPEKYKGRPRIPSYLPRNGRYLMFYTNQQSGIKDGRIRLDKDLFVDIPQWDVYGEHFNAYNQIRLIPEMTKTKVEIVYELEEKQADVDKDRCASIDLGIDNLATMVTPTGCVIWSGRLLKSKNQWFNKELARLRSIKDLQHIKGDTNRIRAMFEKRDRQFNDIMHKYSRQIVERLVADRVGMLVVGYNEGWKNGVDMGKVNNQKFVGIPYLKLLDLLEYKCKLIGIEFKRQQESHTSKCDALAMEEVGHHDTYLGRRVRRGLFRSSTGTELNADVNGALNIMRRAVGDDYVRHLLDGGLSLSPTTVKHPF